MRSFLARTVVVVALVTSGGMAEAQIPQKFTNLKVLRKDMPRPEMVALMRSVASALGVRCEHCHVGAEKPDFKGTDFASDALAPKRTARLMMKMVADINRRYLPPSPAAAERVECVTCHRGLAVPRTLAAELTDVLDKKGVAAAVARYRELRAAAFGRGGYDFGQGTLNQMGERLIKAGRPADALVLLRLNQEFFPDAPWTRRLAEQAQAAPGGTPAPQAASFKNVQHFSGLSELELQRTMNFMRAALGVHCDFCHVVSKEGGWQWEKDDKETKVAARRMIAMVQQINQGQFAGRTVVSCYTCHRGHQRPAAVPPLPQAQPPFPTVAESTPQRDLPSADTIWQRFREAVNMPAPPVTRVLKGKRIDEKESADLEVRQKGERALVVVNWSKGHIEQALDGEQAWVRDEKGTRSFNATETARFREVVDSLTFPPSTPVDGRVTGKEAVDGHDAWVLEWAPVPGHVERLFFDVDTALLLRRDRLTLRSIGLVPERVDYADYRDVGGGRKMPATFTTAYVDPWIGATRTFSEISLDVPVDDALFARPQTAPAGK